MHGETSLQCAVRALAMASGQTRTAVKGKTPEQLVRTCNSVQTAAQAATAKLARIHNGVCWRRLSSGMQAVVTQATSACRCACSRDLICASRLA